MAQGFGRFTHLVFFTLKVGGGTQPRGGFGGFAVLARIDGWKPITGCYFIFGFGYLLILTFIVARLREDAGFSDGTASTVYAFMGLSTLIGGIGMGRLSDVTERRTALMVGYGCWAPAVAALATSSLRSPARSARSWHSRPSPWPAG